MLSLRSILRPLLMAVAMTCLVIGLNNCSQAPSSSAPSASPAAATANPVNSDRKININSSILSELDKIEAELGVPALSHQIQASRPYGSIDDLVSKGVLKPDQFDKVKDQVTVEDIVLTGEAKDVDYLTKLGLMKGHMLIAGQLLKLNLPDQAEPHLGHPVEEIYVDIQEQLPERKVPEFSSSLTAVQDLVKSKPKDPKVATEYSSAMSGIDKAIAVLPANQIQSPEFVLQAMTEMLDTAASEYTAAISGGKITAAIEYQDSMGFVTYVKDTMFKSIEAKLTQQNAPLAKDLRSKLDNLSKAWTQPVPPNVPVVSADEVANQVKAIEQTVASLKKTAA